MKKAVNYFLVLTLIIVTLASCKKDKAPLPAQFKIDQTSKDFENVEVDKAVSQTFVISNTGEEDLELKSFVIGGANASAFSTDAIKKIVKQGGNYSFNVSFQPKSVGVKSSTMTITSNVGSHKVTLMGNATAKPVGVMTINPSSKDFGEVEISSSKEQTFTIQNTGNANLSINTLSVSGTDAAMFRVKGEASFPITIESNKTTSLTIIFEPNTTGQKTAKLDVKSSVGNQSITLTGTGKAKPVGVMTISPTSKNFGNVEVGSTKAFTFVIKNTGNANISVNELNFLGNDASQFNFNGEMVLPITIAPTKTVNIPVVFRPTTAGNKSTKLKVKSNVGDKSVTITGAAKAKAKAIFNINPGSKDFGQVEVKKTAEQVFTIRNTGTANLVISDIRVKGDDKSQFTTTGRSNTIAPTGNYSFSVSFKPTSTGQKGGGLDIVTNVGTKNVSLLGYGTQAASSCNTPVNITDVNFKNALLAHGYKLAGSGIGKIDANGDGIICQSEASSYTGKIVVSRKNISNLEGISAFTQLKELHITSNNLTSIDLSKNTALEIIEAARNQLTSIDVSKLPNLKILNVYKNGISNLNLASNTALENLQCGLNKLASINVSKNTNLKKLTADNNRLTSLDVSKNTSLKELYARYNKITQVNFGNDSVLEILYLTTNNLTSINLSKLKKIKKLDVIRNQLTSLDLSSNKYLTYLACSINKISSLDVSNNKYLNGGIFCSENNLTSLNVANGLNGRLRSFNATKNPNLTCIQIDNTVTPKSTWRKDATAEYSSNCN